MHLKISCQKQSHLHFQKVIERKMWDKKTNFWAKKFFSIVSLPCFNPAWFGRLTLSRLVVLSIVNKKSFAPHLFVLLLLTFKGGSFFALGWQEIGWKNQLSLVQTHVTFSRVLCIAKTSTILNICPNFWTSQPIYFHSKKRTILLKFSMLELVFFLFLV